MSKYEIKNSVLFVLFESIKIYFTNIDKFLIYMLFPVFGQVIGIALSFGLTLGLAEKIAAKTNSITTALLFIFLLALPGLLIFVKAFWDYMVAYVSLNSMTEGAVTTGKVYDFKSHNEVATRRTLKYVGFLIILSLLMSVGSSIFFIIPGFVLWIYCILVFQVFTFEPDLTIPEIFKKSFLLVKGHWFRTFIIMAVLSFFSIFLITEGVSVIFDYLNLTEPICKIFNFIGNALPLNYINRVLVHFHYEPLTAKIISEWIFLTILGCIVAGMTLPIRSICWALWYKNLSDIKDSYSPNKNLAKKTTKSSRKSKNNEDE